nr:uncharacterized protein LOC123757719 [Procambarus clarkii]
MEAMTNMDPVVKKNVTVDKNAAAFLDVFTANTANMDTSTVNTHALSVNAASFVPNTDSPLINSNASTGDTDASAADTVVLVKMDASLDIQLSANPGTSVMDAPQACEMSSGPSGTSHEDSLHSMSTWMTPPRFYYPSWHGDALSVVYQMPSSSESLTLEGTTEQYGCPPYLENSLVDEDSISRVQQLTPSGEFSTLEGSIQPWMKPNGPLYEEHFRDSAAQPNTNHSYSISRNPEPRPEAPDTSPEAVFKNMMLKNRVTFCNIPRGAHYEQIKTLVGKSGPVFRMTKEQNMMHVIYLQENGAEKAFNTKHRLLGQDLVVLRPTSRLCSLFLGGLPPGTSNRHIVKAVDAYGAIISMTRPTHPNNGLPVNYCFVFIKETAGMKILEQKYININNRWVFVELAKNQLVEPRPLGVYKVFLKHLPDDISYLEVREYFSQFGNLLRVFVKNKKGFLCFDSEEATQYVLSVVHVLKGKIITVTEDDVPEIQLFFGGLPPNVSNDTIMEEVSKYGTVLDMFRPHDKFTGELASFFFATFEDRSTAQYLIDRGHVHIHSKEVRVRQSKRSVSGGDYFTYQ